MVLVDVSFSSSTSSRKNRSLIRQQCVLRMMSWIWIWIRILIVVSGMFVWLSMQQGSKLKAENTDYGIKMKTMMPKTNKEDDHPLHYHVEASTSICPVTSISELSDSVRNPSVGSRWAVTPPSKGDDVHLMCCETTKGSFNILLHSAWAPIGVAHLLEMLEHGYFEQDIPLFRCTDACQFGLSSNTTRTKQFDRPILDDPLWLPTGPQHQIINGIPRYPKGVMTHAGGGPNTRSNQFVITLKPNKFMGGGSPWEVPLGEIVGKSSHGEDDKMEVLDRLFTGYGENGPSQAMLRKTGVTLEMMDKWPLMDYIHRCHLLESETAA
jgi:cyclophilin family peptidyl-prolyl cis-trans isomerase